MPHEAMVEGEQISKEEAESNGWITAHRKRNADKTRLENETRTAGHSGARVGARNAGQLRKVAAASRLPRLPKSHFRVVVRPGGGLDVRKCSQLKVTQAILMAARLPPAAAEEDIVCANAMQNIFVISTPSESNANAYSTVQEIILADKRHPITAYITPPGNTCRGVVRGIDADLPEAALQSLFVTPKNPMVLGVRRIKESTTVIVLFNGMKVPNYVRCGPNMVRCTLYKRQIDTCRNCGRIGHRQDVCPRPTEKVCDLCGTLITTNGHECVQPKCALCGDAHLTGDRTCRNRYQVPYVVRRRRRRRKSGKKKNATSNAANAGGLGIPASTETPTAEASRNATPERSRSRSKSRSRVRINSQPTWADKAAKTGLLEKREDIEGINGSVYTDGVAIWISQGSDG
ncbi:hypothetical protein HPB52_008695 [Rhipicephalus sanguineus]|uniref:CCHC-type domain-containing protein n=1 Tax=Rhipicephalus sanguineus TaxID=34632 RepID=A0A9D4SY41_RHISA|nr:hypothetical protein HPB52_008695 [Rhipicephalus sanguineus]